jgi:hypothetical protein
VFQKINLFKKTSLKSLSFGTEVIWKKGMDQKNYTRRANPASWKYVGLAWITYRYVFKFNRSWIIFTKIPVYFLQNLLLYRSLRCWGVGPVTNDFKNIILFNKTLIVDIMSCYEEKRLFYYCFTKIWLFESEMLLAHLTAPDTCTKFHGRIIGISSISTEMKENLLLLVGSNDPCWSTFFSNSMRGWILFVEIPIYFMHTLVLFGSSRYFKEVHLVSTEIHVICIGNYYASLAKREKCKNLIGVSQQLVQFWWKWK